MPTVLLVDDDDVIRESLKDVFEIQGSTYLGAKDSIEALKLATERQPALVILDIKLDGSPLDGFGILEELNKLPIRSKMKIVMVTGYHDEATQARAKAMGADDYLTKPMPIEKLLALLKPLG